MFDPRADILRDDTLLRDDIFIRWPWLGWGIHGVEVTQAIQYYESARHLTDPADRQPDNAVTLIASKPAWVRVYVRSSWFSGDIPGVTGTITVRRRILGFLWQNIGTLNPEPPGSVTARRNPPYATERGTLGYTLNFIVPADLLCGNIRLDIQISTPGGWAATRSVHIDATLRQTLRLAGIMVGYNGPTSTAAGAPTITLAAPTLADLQTTSAWTLLTFPVQSAATYRTAGTVTWSLPLTDPPSCAGCCSPNWVSLNTAVQAVRVADGEVRRDGAAGRVAADPELVEAEGVGEHLDEVNLSLRPAVEVLDAARVAAAESGAVGRVDAEAVCAGERRHEAPARGSGRTFDAAVQQDYCRAGLTGGDVARNRAVGEPYGAAQ